jgi:outer membrane receptor protein involved in Fe transport
LALSDTGQNADISFIPTSAIARVEVLTDGASAIYGSDAVGGVVNFVLREDFGGAETRLSYGGVTSGGLRQGNVTQAFGRNWKSGNGLVSYDYFSASALDRTDRTFTIRPRVGPGTLTPNEVRQSILATLSQDASDSLAVEGAVVYGRRDVKNEASDLLSTNPLNHSHFIFRSNTETLFANLGIDYEISDALNASLTASYSKVDVDADTTNLRFNRNPQTYTTTIRDTHHAALDLTVKVDGSLLTLPGGVVRFSLGAGLLDEQYSGRSVFLRTITGELGRETTYAFGEVFVPILRESQGVPFLEQLELSLAARYTDYNDTSSPALGRDFGDGLDPKIGLLWAPISSLRFRATYGTSFRAPTLSQLDPSSTSTLLVGNLRVPAPSGPLSTVFQVSARPDSNLAPETARTFTAGFDLHAAARRNFRVSATYYKIDYEDRIAPAFVRSDLLANPGAYPDAFYRPPSAEFIEGILRETTNVSNNTGVSLADPAAAAAIFFANPTFFIFDQRLRNLSLSRQDGFDILISDAFDIANSRFDFGVQMTRILDYQQQNSVNTPAITAVDTLEQPTDLRGRLFAGLSRGGAQGVLSVNYVDDYDNPAPPSGISSEVESWTTVDLNFSFEFGASGHLLDGARMSLSVQNLMDEDPPFAERSSAGENLGYDSANANPLGRLVVLGLTKKW